MRVVSIRPGDLAFSLGSGRTLVLRTGSTDLSAEDVRALFETCGGDLRALRAEGWLQWDEPPAVTAPVLPEPMPVRVTYETEPEPIHAMTEIWTGACEPAEPAKPSEAPRRRSRAKRG